MSPSPSGSPAAGSGRWVIFAAGLVWCGLLATLVLTSSNRVVVNRAQVLASTLIVIGQRDSQKPNELVVEQIWLGENPGERISVSHWPTVCPTGKIVVPLMRRGNEPFRVTHGELPNPPVKPNELPEAALVQPLVYPATKDTLEQLTALVGPAQAK